MILFSPFSDPFINLAIEDWLFRHALTDQPIFFLYINAPCVVIGRAQNPWLECNLNLMASKNINLVRRQSGGGTVYHDLGNLNFSFISLKNNYDKERHLSLLIKALAPLKINAMMNERFDLMVKKETAQTSYKITGSAFREARDRGFHHGTLLINADIDHLGGVLRSPVAEQITAKGVKSKRSPVSNLNMLNPQLTCTQVIQSLIDQAHSLGWGKQVHKIILPNHEDPNWAELDAAFSMHSQPYELPETIIKTKAHELTSWDWRFGKTLPFTFQYEASTQAHPINIPIVKAALPDCEALIELGIPDSELNQTLKYIHQNLPYLATESNPQNIC